MSYLLIDNSNTRTKFVLASAEGLSNEVIKLDTQSLNSSVLEQYLGEWNFDAVLIGSVVPKKAQLLVDFFNCPVHLLQHDSPHGIEIKLKNPEQVGADRIANALGVKSLFSSPAIVIDFGTAVTFDVLDETGAYTGGAIAPGLGALNDYLHKKTALLPRIEIKKPAQAIGQSTVEAMQSGAVYGYIGLVQGIISAIQKELKTVPKIITTGGDGLIIARELKEVNAFSPFLTLEGLRSAAVSIFSNQIKP